MTLGVLYYWWFQSQNVFFLLEGSTRIYSQIWYYFQNVQRTLFYTHTNLNKSEDVMHLTYLCPLSPFVMCLIRKDQIQAPTASQCLNIIVGGKGANVGNPSAEPLYNREKPYDEQNLCPAHIFPTSHKIITIIEWGTI